MEWRKGRVHRVVVLKERERERKINWSIGAHTIIEVKVKRRRRERRRKVTQSQSYVSVTACSHDDEGGQMNNKEEELNGLNAISCSYCPI